MTYTNIIPEAERMTVDEAFKRADMEGGPQGYLSAYREALAKRIQMTEPKPVDLALEAFVVAVDSPRAISNEEFMTRFRAELAKRGLKIGPIDGEEG